MRMMKSLFVGAAMIAATLATPTLAQEVSYNPGSVWETSRIDVLPGQFENYMDYLATTWKKNQEMAKAEGIVLDTTFFLATNNARADEPDLIRIVEYKDYRTIAQQEAFSKEGQRNDGT